ncbi:MAG: xanthine dehydrogenase family protein molybdopterin-binding subunit [Pseudomonadota bacterium]
MNTYAKFQGRIEDARFVTGDGYYATDLKAPGMVHAAVVRSPVACGRIESLDVEEARAAPGVLAVYTAQDLAAGGPTHMPAGPNLPMTNGEPAFQAKRPLLAIDRVRYVGQAIAFIVAETGAAARDAVELVEVDIEEEDAVTEALDALAADAPVVHTEVPDNIAYVWSRGDHDAAKAAIDAAPRKVQVSSHVTRIAVHSMEPRACLARMDGGRIYLESCSQSPHAIKGMIAGIFGVEKDQVRVRTHDVGGSFGMKIAAYAEDILSIHAARDLGRPVKWASDRSEAALTDDHGRDMRFDGTLAFDDDGNLLGLRVHWDINIGAYLQGRSLGGLGNLGGISGPYRIGPTAADAYGVYTHTHTTGPYRGAGRPEATYCIERLMDLAAHDLGMDPFEFRRRNLVPPEAMPWDTGFMFEYDCGEFEENMVQAREKADLAGFPARRAEAAARGKLRGIGMANPIEVAGGPFTKPGGDHCRITVTEDGGAVIHPGAMSVGQGLETAFSDMVSTAFNIPREKIDYRQGDTDDLPAGRGSGGSSSAPVGGSVLVLAIDKVIEKGLAMASDMLETAPADIDFDAGEYRIVGTDRRVTLPEVARAAAEREETLDGQGHFEPEKVTFPNGCHICEVEVDPETGTLTIERYTVVEDVGRVLNATLLSGQMHGGIAMGVGQTLLEHMHYEPGSGQPLTASFMDYAMPRADMLPDMNFTHREVPTKVNPVGAKGVGEAGSVGSLAASMNAVIDALRPLGVSHMEMPCTPQRVWAAINAAKNGSVST